MFLNFLVLLWFDKEFLVPRRAQSKISETIRSLFESNLKSENFNFRGLAQNLIFWVTKLCRTYRSFHKVIKKTVEMMPDDCVLFVMGDHGKNFDVGLHKKRVKKIVK